MSSTDRPKAKRKKSSQNEKDRDRVTSRLSRDHHDKATRLHQVFKQVAAEKGVKPITFQDLLGQGVDLLCEKYSLPAAKTNTATALDASELNDITESAQQAGMYTNLLMCNDPTEELIGAMALGHPPPSCQVPAATGMQQGTMTSMASSKTKRRRPQN